MRKMLEQILRTGDLPEPIRHNCEICLQGGDEKTYELGLRYIVATTPEFWYENRMARQALGEEQ